MKILYIVQDFPTVLPENGYRLKLLSVFSYIGKRHDCHVIGFGSGMESQEVNECERLAPRLTVIGALEKNTGLQLRWRQARRLVTGRGLTATARFEGGGLREAVESALATTQFDVIHVDMAALCEVIDWIPEGKSVLSVNDALSLTTGRLVKVERSVRKRWRIMFEYRRAQDVERRVYSRFSAVHVVSDVDASCLRETAGLKNVVVIRLAVGQKYFSAPIGPKQSCSAGRGAVIWSAGKLWDDWVWRPLAAFLQEYWQALTREHHGARFVIVGRGAPRRLEALAAGLEGVEIRERIENYAEVLGGADVAVFFDEQGPSGTKTRVLEALAAGRAVVGTSLAFEGLGVKDRQHCIIGDGPKELYQGVVEVLRSASMRDRLGAEGRALVAERHGVETVGKQWEYLYKRVSAGLAPNCSSA
jgi:glycosyltransferase involved in cell wall biosynthesis